jgi:hypothetical protein
MRLQLNSSQSNLLMIPQRVRSGQAKFYGARGFIMTTFPARTPGVPGEISVAFSGWVQYISAVLEEGTSLR